MGSGAGEEDLIAELDRRVLSAGDHLREMWSAGLISESVFHKLVTDYALIRNTVTVLKRRSVTGVTLQAPE